MDISTEYKAENSTLDMREVLTFLNNLPTKEICKAYDILNEGFKSRSHYSVKVREMQSIFSGKTQPCCSFERWLLLIEYLKAVGCKF